MRKCNGNNGSELHRLKPMQDYDEAMFNGYTKFVSQLFGTLPNRLITKGLTLRQI